MRKLNRKQDSEGYTLVELMIAVGILAAMVSAVIYARSYMAKQVVRTVQKGYATQKAIQMFEELRSVVGGNENVAVLDNYSDGNGYNTVLTTDKKVDVNPPAVPNPADPVSGNKTVNGHWTYLRQVQVNRVGNDVNARQVIVKVWRYLSDQNPTAPGELLSTVGGILRTIQGPFPPTQVLDVYVLDVNTIQAWWDVLPNLYSGMQSVISDMQNRNPGLQLRTHYITRASFGRDSQYIPYINNALGTDQSPMGWAYFYPGNTPQDANPNGCGCESKFFDPTNSGVPQCGNFNVDGTVVSPGTFTNGQVPLFSGCPSFAVEDQSNNALRYPDENALYNAITVAAASSGQTAIPEISERMLIEGMNSFPASFMNAMIINLHGELLPLPALRNYSDAAKDPGSLGTVAGLPTVNPSIYGTGSAQTFNDQYVRVVTHPELLYYPQATSSSAVTVNLRVYAYYDGWQDTQASLPANQQVPAISVFLPDYNSTNLPSASVLGVTYIYGGAGITYVPDPLVGAGGVWSHSAGVAADTATMKLTYVGVANQALITLYNTDLRCPTGANNTGLNSSDDLYGLEYIPCSPNVTSALSAYPFTFTTHDLTYSAGSGTPKNTARWIISLSLPVTSTFTAGAGSVTVLGQAYTAPVTFPTSLTTGGNNAHVIETRLGDGVTTSAVTLAGGAVTNIPSNLSRTYVWLGNSFPPPATEQYQMVGDPRHCPYLDCKVGGIALGGTQPVTIGPDAYNWYFKGISGVAGYSGWGKTQNGWANGDEVDLPKYDLLIRQGLMSTTSIWTTLNGYSFYYYGLGGEFGFDHPPYTNSINIQQAPYLTSTAGMNTVKTVNELVNWNGGTLNISNERLVALANGGQGKDKWYSRYWMGELYPDSMAATWTAYGNLPTVASALAGEKFFREDYANISTAGTASLNGFGGNSFIRLQSTNGCSSFFNGGSTNGSYYNHDYFDGNTGTSTSLATTCYGIFTYLLPSVVNLARPFALDCNNNAPPQDGIAPYKNIMCKLSLPQVASSGVSRLYYTSPDTSGSSNSGKWYGSGVVQVDNVKAGSMASPTARGYVVETGTSPSANVGTQDLSEMALTETLRTFLDGGVMYSAGSLGHIDQVPLVELWTNVVPQFNNPTSIPLIIDGAVTTGTALAYSGFLTVGAGPTTNVWYRYPGVTSNTGNFYTEEYPGYGGGITTSTYNESAVSLVYNLKWYNNGPNQWYYMQSPQNIPATFGVYSPSYAVTGSLPITYNLDVSNTALWGQGDYNLMVEAYRFNTATAAYMPLHYAYHELTITINR